MTKKAIMKKQRVVLKRTIKDFRKAEIVCDNLSGHKYNYIIVKKRCELCKEYRSKSSCSTQCPIIAVYGKRKNIPGLARCFELFREEYPDQILKSNKIVSFETEKEAEKCKKWCIFKLKELLEMRKDDAEKEGEYDG